jgi:hypothetical protein
VSVAFPGGTWSTLNTSVVIFQNATLPSTTLSCSVTGNVVVLWTSPTSIIYSRNLNIVGPIVASIPVLNKKFLCGMSILIVTGIVAAIWLYRVWNRRLVKFRDDDVAIPKSEYYRF